MSRYNKRTAGSIANCIDHDELDDEVCEECAKGYAVSYDEDSCIPFSFCYYLLEGDKKCGQCYEGYYFDGKECTKISIDNCLRSDDDGTHCKECTINYKINSDGTQCELIANKKNIDGCGKYGDDGYCEKCANNLYIPSGSGNTFKCTLNGCTGDQVVNYCSSCEIGYYIDRNDGNCKPYSTGNSKNSEVRYTFLILMLVLLI